MCFCVKIKKLERIETTSSARARPNLLALTLAEERIRADLDQVREGKLAKEDWVANLETRFSDWLGDFQAAMGTSSEKGGESRRNANAHAAAQAQADAILAALPGRLRAAEAAALPTALEARVAGVEAQIAALEQLQSKHA